MAIQMNPYLAFQDGARDAMAYYQAVFGGEPEFLTYAEAGMSNDPSNDERVMHAQLVTEHGFVLMASDVPDGVAHEPGSSISISLSGSDEQVLRGCFDTLAEEGTIIEPLERAPWGDSFGACIDRFGTSWMVNIDG